MPEHGRDGELIQAKYPDSLKKRLLSLLERRHFRALKTDNRRPITAMHLAHALKFRPANVREVRRRRVRELVEECRLDGAPIASGPGGYWLATEVDDFDRTETFLRRMGLAELTTAANIRRSAARSAAAGQLTIATPLIHRALRGALNLYRTTNHPAGDAGEVETPPPIAATLFG